MGCWGGGAAGAQWPVCNVEMGPGWMDRSPGTFTLLLLLAVNLLLTGAKKTGLKREHTVTDPTVQGRLKRHRPDGQASDSSFPFQQQQESRPYSIIPQQQEPYVPVRGDEIRLESPGQRRAHDNTRGIPVNHLGFGNHLQGVGTSDQSANYYPPQHLSLHQHARHGRPDAAPAGIHSGTDTPPHREIPLAQGLSQDTLPPFVSRAARERGGVGGYTAGGVPGGQQPVEERRGSPEETRASPDDCSSPEDSSALVVPRGAGTNSVRLGLVSNFQTGNRGDLSFDASSEPSESEDDAEGDSDELEDYQDDRSHLSQSEDADIELEDAGDAEEESSNEDEDLCQPGFDNSVVLRRATAYRLLQSRNDRTVDSVVRTLQASRLDDSDSDTDTSSSDLSSDENQHCSPDQGYDTQDELAEEIHRAEFAYDDDDDKVDLIRRKYGPPMDSPDSTTRNEDTNKGRRTLRPQEREDVKNTRHMGACVRCRLQKIKVNRSTLPEPSLFLLTLFNSVQHGPG